jgi:hypothetical protein
LPEGIFSSANAVQQPGPGLPVVGAADEGGPTGHRVRDIRAQWLTERCELEAPTLKLVHDVHARQCAQQAVQRGRVRAGGGGGQFVIRSACVGQQIGDAKRCEDVDRL